MLANNIINDVRMNPKAGNPLLLSSAILSGCADYLSVVLLKAYSYVTDIPTYLISVLFLLILPSF